MRRTSSEGGFIIRALRHSTGDLQPWEAGLIEAEVREVRDEREIPG